MTNDKVTSKVGKVGKLDKVLKRYQRKPKPANKPGRPAGTRESMTDETLDSICEGIAEGMSIAEVAGLVGVDKSTIYREVYNNEAFAKQFDASMVAFYGVKASELASYALETQAQVEECTAVTLAPSVVAARKLYADTIKWLIERRLASKYGNKVIVGDAGGKVSIVFDIPAPSTGAE
jgi:hypothetical protein